MKKSLFVAVAALVFAAAASPALAGHGGQAGLGLLYSDVAPVGFFYGLDDKTMVHFGFGFNKFDVATGSGDLETVFGIAAALEYDIWGGDNWGFGVFPAITFQSFSPEGAGDGSSSFGIALDLGGHADIVDNVAVFFKHGFTIDIFSPPVGDSTTDFGTSGWNLGEFGAAFFF